MGMTIDNSCEPKPMSKEEIVDTLKTMVFGVQAFEWFNAKERETLDKSWNLIDQYETRLKADMVAMLTDLKKEIEGEKQDIKHLHYNDLENAESYNNGIDNCIDIIQQKINSLREPSFEAE